MHLAVDDPEIPWYRPGVYQVADDVFRIPLEIPNDGLRAVNAYALRDAAGWTLIDPGVAAPQTTRQLGDAVALLEIGEATFSAALVTHIHYDHFSQAILLRERAGVPVWLGRHEQPALQALRRRVPTFGSQVRLLRFYGAPQLAAHFAEQPGLPAIDDLMRQGPDTWIEDSVLTLPGGPLQAIHTPGHTQGHVVFHAEEAGLLFAGDHILPTITPSIGFELSVKGNALAAYLRSLHAVRQLPDRRLLPAHGAVTSSTHARIEELLAHHDRRFEACTDVLRDGEASAALVAARLRWTRHERHLDELDPFNQMLAILETGFHLDLLVTREQLVRDRDDEVFRYRLP